MNKHVYKIIIGTFYDATTYTRCQEFEVHAESIDEAIMMAWSIDYEPHREILCIKRIK